MMPATIFTNDALPDGLLTGLNAAGRVIVCIEFAPNYKFIWGTPDDQDDVTEWHVCNAHARRLAMVGAWRAAEYPCRGNA